MKLLFVKHLIHTKYNACWAIVGTSTDGDYTIGPEYEFSEFFNPKIPDGAFSIMSCIDISEPTSGHFNMVKKDCKFLNDFRNVPYYPSLTRGDLVAIPVRLTIRRDITYILKQ